MEAINVASDKPQQQQKWDKSKYKLEEMCVFSLKVKKMFVKISKLMKHKKYDCETALSVSKCNFMEFPFILNLLNAKWH